MKYKFNINHLDCMNCANKIEQTLKNDKNILNANVNFSNLKLTIETNYEGNVLDYLNNIIKKVEPDVYVYQDELKQESITFDIIRVIVGIFLGIIGLMTKGLISNIILILAYIILLSKTFMRALNLIIKSKTINENFLITISCIGAYIIDKQSEGLMVAVLYEIGKILEAKAVNNSRKSIANLMDLAPTYANLKTNKDVEEVKPETVEIGDIIIVKAGEKIPLDGIVTKGEASLNVSALTGESILKKVKKNDEVLSGSLNYEGLLEIKVTSIYEDSTVNKILELVENATDKKAPTETFVTKASRIYTPTVFVLALLVIVFGCIFTNLSFSSLFYKALVFLVISCPCSIAISVPLSYFAGIGTSSKKGILVKGSNYLDNLRNIKKIIFDKTGTLTTGDFNHIEIELLNKNYTKKQIKEIIVKGELLSNHPIAKSLVNNLRVNTTNEDVTNFVEHKGKGISFTLNKDNILIGNSKFCKIKEQDENIYVVINDNLSARISITDEIKKEASKTIKDLQSQGIICEMFTGDSKNKALKIGSSLNLDNIQYELLPTDKYTLLEKYLNEFENPIAFVGDGINDAPVLALASIGISMGGVGSSSAIEASDIVIMNDELNKINEAIKISKYTNKIIKENLVFALSFKVLVLLLSILGVATMWQAVFADVGVTLITILNSMRITKK